MRINGLMGLAAAALLAVAAGSTVTGQSPQTVWDGVYSAEQADRGMKVYLDNCAACHGAEMTAGAGAPSLTGPEFQFSWNKKPVGGLFDYAQMFMPPGQPGSLTGQQYADLISAILRVNGFPAGSTELPATKAELDTITFLTTKP